MILAAPVIESYNEIAVVRDDLLPGGTKMRALLPILLSSPYNEFVYASPAYGYAQVALAMCASAIGKRATIFVAKRAVPHPLTIKAKNAGAKIMQVQHGYLNVVTARARAYANCYDAEIIDFGGEHKLAFDAIASAARQIPIIPEEVWSVAGSGVLTRSLQMAWPSAEFHAIVVGKKDTDTGRAKRYVYPLEFEKDARVRPPFPSAKNYDAKAWEYILKYAKPGALFWNVGA